MPALFDFHMPTVECRRVDMLPAAADQRESGPVVGPAWSTDRWALGLLFTLKTPDGAEGKGESVMSASPGDVASVCPGAVRWYRKQGTP